ncbi:MAG: response regulator [Chitinophagaceae bacterium]|nr:response regulator [Chitinophagaceae bacterium]
MIDVLIVDDDPDLLEMISLALSNYNMRVDCLNEGKSLIDSVSKKRPDVILLDIYLGDTDGRDLCQTIKSSNQYREIPIILYSAGNITSKSITESQADAFFTKPFNIDQLVDRITTLKNQS